QHARAWVIAKEPQTEHYLLSAGCFLLLFFIYTDFKTRLGKTTGFLLRIIAILLAVLFLYFSEFSDGKGFNYFRSDIILIVLANMALFGSFIWWFTKDSPLLRLGVLPLIMAVFLASGIEGSWNERLYNFTLIPWAYKFYYLKYLFIIMAGTFAGEWMLQRAANTYEEGRESKTILWTWAAIAAIIITITNTIFLYTREIEINLIVSLAGI